uniref:Uncharacterized protein n=1 Tax=Rhizophora mucronata TaxID=61149 RepID=A0A2P2J1V5_RHIMU
MDTNKSNTKAKNFKKNKNKKHTKPIDKQPL